MYYGEKKIAFMTDPIEGRTVITFEDGTTENISALMGGSAITQEATDATRLRELRCFPVVKEILEVLFKHDIHIGELGFVLQRVNTHLLQG